MRRHRESTAGPPRRHRVVTAGGFDAGAMTDTTTAPSSTPTAARPLVTGLNHVAVTTADLDRLCAFYAELLDAEIIDTPAPPGTRAATIRIGHGAGLAVLE